MQATAPVHSLRSMLPRGQTLPDDVWQHRHRWFQRLLWAHVVGIPLFGIAQGFSVGHSVLEGSPLLLIALLARRVTDRRLAACLMAGGLLTSSALLVHLWHGAIEAHFHFFVMIPVLALYEDWVPFLLAVAYVAIHHGLAGAIHPEYVYNHADARSHPWKWAAIHGGFVAAAGAVSIVSWRLNEEMREQTRSESHRRADAEAVSAALQQGLRPDTLPDLEQGHVAARYLPAAAQQIGGDWYDVLALPDGRVALTLGDVAGHGIEAASSMAGLRHSVRAYAHEGLSPAQVAERVERLFEGEFATFVYLVYDPRRSELRFVNTGHLPPLMVSPDGEPRFLLESLSLPLGLRLDTAFAEGRVDFPAGSAVIAYTDGLVERRRERIDRQLERLRTAVAECAPGAGAEALCECALAAFPAGGGDDVALLAFRAAPVAGEIWTVPSDAAALGRSRMRLRRWLDANGATAVADDLVLAVSEVLANVVVHSGSERGAEVELSRREREVAVTVRDFGRWSEGDSDPDGGRGLFLAGALTDRFEIVSTDGGTTVTLASQVAESAAVARALSAAGGRSA